MTLGLPKFNKAIFKSNAVQNGQSRSFTPPTHLRMAIIPTHEPSNPLLTTLLLNPDSITETKAANWVRHNIPGQSDPLMQWVNGTERTVTFTAKVTLDLLENPTVEYSYEDYWSLEIEPELSEISEITEGYNAAILSQLSAVSPRDPLAINDPTAVENSLTQRWRQSIQPQLDFYRGLLVPRQSSRPNESRTPPLVRLYMGNILGSQAYSEHQNFFLASYNFQITQCTPQLLPTSADVTFTFIEYNDTGKTVEIRESREAQSYYGARQAEIDKNAAIRANTDTTTVSTPSGGASTGFDISAGI